MINAYGGITENEVIYDREDLNFLDFNLTHTSSTITLRLFADTVVN